MTEAMQIEAPALSPATAHAGSAQAATPLYDHVCNALRMIYDRRLDGAPVLDCAEYFPNAQRFAHAWRQVRDEALGIASRIETVPRFEEIMPEQAAISRQDRHDWRMFILKAYGAEVPQHMARCPALASLLRQTPEVLSAAISFLAPGKHVPRHRGPFRGILRFHLGLSMPLGKDGRPAAVLQIADGVHRLADGECLLWDDTYPHEVLNASPEVRIALLLDVRRQGMPFDMRLLSSFVISAVRLGMRYRGISYGG